MEINFKSEKEIKEMTKEQAISYAYTLWYSVINKHYFVKKDDAFGCTILEISKVVGFLATPDAIQNYIQLQKKTN
jgi:hypothetical protein